MHYSTGGFQLYSWTPSFIDSEDLIMWFAVVANARVAIYYFIAKILSLRIRILSARESPIYSMRLRFISGSLKINVCGWFPRQSARVKGMGLHVDCRKFRNVRGHDP